MPYTKTLLIKNRPSQKKPKAVKDRGGGSRVAKQDDYNKGICSPWGLVNNSVR